MKIRILEIKGTVIKFDIVDRGNVLMDYAAGVFDSKVFDDNVDETEKEFYDFILENIDIIIKNITKPTYQSIKHDIDYLNMSIINNENITYDIKNTLLTWIDTSLKILIENEDYERCDIIKKFKEKLNNLKIKDEEKN